MSTPTLSIEAVAHMAAIAHVVALRIYCRRLEALQMSLEPPDGSVPLKCVLDNGVKLLALKEKALRITPQVKQRMGVECWSSWRRWRWMLGRSGRRRSRVWGGCW